MLKDAQHATLNPEENALEFAASLLWKVNGDRSLQ
jgi:hypothetical protein